MADPLALIFDMDGVILDSNPTHREAWARFNRQFGLATTEDMHARMYGKRNDEIIRDFFGEHLDDAEVASRGALKEQLFREMIGPGIDAALVRGVRSFLETHQDHPIGLATNAEPANVDFVLERAGLAHLFQVTVDGHQVARGKPFPDIYLKVATLLGVSPSRCVVFEDSRTGVDSARAAGMRVVGLLTTHSDLAGVDFAISDFEDTGLDSWLGGLE